MHTLFVLVTLSYGLLSAQKHTWHPTGSLYRARESHVATLLADGRVLVTGGFGYDPYGPESSAEIYNSATGTWSRTGNLISARYHHSATLLPTGEVLVTGGVGPGFGAPNVRSAELYDPKFGRWRTTGSMRTARALHSATLLPDGKVLVAGGGTSIAELYDRLTETWSSTGDHGFITHRNEAVLLPDGNVFAVGAVGNNCANVAEFYNPKVGRWSPAPLPSTECLNRLTLLVNGGVLATGAGKAEMFSPETGAWRALQPSGMYSGYAATLLGDGRVLLTGGRAGDWALNSVAIYDPGTEQWSFTPTLPNSRAEHSATLLPDGKVLVASGFPLTCCDAFGDTETADLFDPGPLGPGKASSFSAAGYGTIGVAPEGLAVSFGSRMATTNMRAESDPGPTELAGTSLKIKDATGAERLAPLLFVSPTQIAYQIPAGTAAGRATFTVTSEDGTVSTGVIPVRMIAPALFAANADGQGVASAIVRRTRADGSSVDEQVHWFDSENGKFMPLPIDLGSGSDRVVLVLSGSGIRFRSDLKNVVVTIGGVYADVISAAARQDTAGVDEVAVLVPRSLRGRGVVDVLLTVDAQMANPVQVHID